ncbi:unnamed protein product [Protopolystoma xenopodis]|uniref:Uncharacterized protein n=1 Tax=Protopolystoma xenopodis TaxID=117903 RepID=A0A3S5AQF5_9PLAT|nr:unnamed protein product [Protopolystoma xenopodis]
MKDRLANASWTRFKGPSEPSPLSYVAQHHDRRRRATWKCKFPQLTRHSQNCETLDISPGFTISASRPRRKSGGSTCLCQSSALTLPKDWTGSSNSAGLILSPEWVPADWRLSEGAKPRRKYNLKSSHLVRTNRLNSSN